MLHRKSRKRDQVDAVALLQRIKIAVARAHPDDIGNAGKTPRRCSHPHHIMIAPLNVNTMIFPQRIKNDLRSRSPVIDIPDNVQMIDDEPLDEIAQGNDKSGRTADLDNSLNDTVIIRFLILDLLFFCDQFFNDVCKITRQRLPHLRACIFGCHAFRDLHEAVKRDLIPVLKIVLLLHDDLQLFLWIVDQRCQTLLIPHA